MTQPRLPHTRATERRTGGTDATETPCAGRWFVYDILVDNSSGPAYHNAIAEARAICATCPISTACLLANRDEEWAQAVITGKTLMERVKGPKSSQSAQEVAPARASRAPCGTEAGARRHQKVGEDPCEACRVAKNAAYRDWYRRRKQGAA